MHCIGSALLGLHIRSVGFLEPEPDLNRELNMYCTVLYCNFTATIVLEMESNLVLCKYFVPVSRIAYGTVVGTG